MTPLPKRKLSTRRQGKRWAAKLNERKRKLQHQNPLVHKHLRSLSAKSS